MQFAPLSRPFLLAPFFEFSYRYPETIKNYPSNSSIVVEPPAVARALNRKPCFIGATEECLFAAAQSRPDQVLGLYAGDVPPDAAEALSLKLKALWFNLTGRHVPFAWYITRWQVHYPSHVPASVDIAMPEFYFDDPPNRAECNALMWDYVAKWGEAIGTQIPWLPALQAYDRNLSPPWQANANSLGLIQEIAFDVIARNCPWIVGLAPFAVHRPGGASTYPDVIVPYHEAILAAIPSDLPRLSIRDPKLNPPIVTTKVEPPSGPLHDGWRWETFDEANPDIKVELWVENGSIYQRLTHRGGTARTGRKRPVV